MLKPYILEPRMKSEAYMRCFPVGRQPPRDGPDRAPQVHGMSGAHGRVRERHPHHVM